MNEASRSGRAREARFAHSPRHPSALPFMALRARLLVPLLVLSALAACSGEPAWVVVEPADGGFRFEVPDTPTEGGQKLDTDAGEARMRSWLHQTEQRGFLVGYTDYPAEYGEQLGASKMLDGARDRAVERSGGKLRGERSVSVQGFPGRYVDIDAAGGRATVRGQLVLADSRLYYVLATVPPADAVADDVVRFLDSFRLVDTPPSP